MVSIIITYHAEGQEFLEECITQVRSSVHVPYEIIVVDDFSPTPLKPISDIQIIRKPYQSGVGNSFDLGVSMSKYDNLFLMACDTRYIDNGWCDRLLEEIKNYPKSLISTASVGLNKYSRCCEADMHKGICLKCRQPAKDNMDFTYRRSIKLPQTGAEILIFHDSSNDKAKKPNFRNIIEAKWLPYRGGQSYEVPCILGACYGTTKEWYNYIDGFWGHRYWGSLEPYISLKSWLFGGSCRVLPEAETGHIWKKEKLKDKFETFAQSENGYHNVRPDVLVYNKLMIAHLLFPDAERLISFLSSQDVDKAKRAIQSNWSLIEAKRREYAEKTTVSMESLVELLKLDYRK